MPYLIGTDEAGYGPNLGPLVISATLWEVADGVRSEDLYERLKSVITAAPNGRNGAATVALADSKKLYQSGKGLRLLERGLWAAFSLLGQCPRTCTEVWEGLAPGAVANRRAECGYCPDETAVPLDADADESQSRAVALRQAFDAAGVRLLQLKSRVIFPEQFNALVEQCGSKGVVLSRATLDLAALLLDSLPSRQITVICDKHGGRDRYMPLLNEYFAESLIEIHGEGRQQSVYRFGPEDRRVEFRFQAKAESHMPAALASMASKYLRELAMRALNSFWCSRVPGLAPTAGYPQDALRFKAQIAGEQSRLGIEDRVLWRIK
jgi:ribonuclease HII